MKNKTITKYILLIGAALTVLSSCNKNMLDEVPSSNLSNDNSFKTITGFDNAMTGLIFSARDEFNGVDLGRWYDMDLGTDIGTTGQEQTTNFRNYTTYLTPSAANVASYWNWAYGEMILRSNNIIVNASNPKYSSVFGSDSVKNKYIAEAKFFRAYAYNTLADLFGNVPIVDTLFDQARTDFTRSPRADVYAFAKSDLEFAVQWLPATVTDKLQGHIVKGAAQHLLTEVDISLKLYDDAIKSASDLIGGGVYHLMTERFGANKNNPGDVFSDLFYEGNQNRSSGNMESIYVWEFENLVTGGGGTTGRNNLIRGWAPALWNLKDPNGANGMVITDSLGRGVAYVRPTTWYMYDLWNGNWNSDIRNSVYNMRRVFRYTDPTSAYFGKVVEPRTTQEDTMRNIYAYPRKIEGTPWNNDPTSGGTGKDFIVYRLAETYLLRAEAYLDKGDLVNAAADINAVRERSHATPITTSQVSIDFILDERARELITEERRRVTLSRLGKLVDRVKKYQTRTDVKSTIQSYHELFPIPQSAIDANYSSPLGQNDGYN